MRLSNICGRSMGLFLISFLVVLASNASATIVPSSAWASLKWPSFSSLYELPQFFPLRYFQKQDADIFLFNSWEHAQKLGQSVQQYTDTLLHDAALVNITAAERLRDFKDTMARVVSGTKELRDEVQKGAEARGLTLENMSEMLSTEMAYILAELKAEFPSPDEANHHKQRVEMVSRALSKMEESVVRVSMQCGVSEADARMHFRNIEPHIQRVTVVVGDLVEQHPVLLETLLFSGAILLIPEVRFLRPILRILGFGPSGPVKGSPAAWMQRRFWGAAVARGSWFARLQSAGMKLPGVGKKIIAPIGVGLGIVGSIFKGHAN